MRIDGGPSANELIEFAVVDGLIVDFELVGPPTGHAKLVVVADRVLVDLQG